MTHSTRPDDRDGEESARDESVRYDGSMDPVVKVGLSVAAGLIALVVTVGGGLAIFGDRDVVDALPMTREDGDSCTAAWACRSGRCLRLKSSIPGLSHGEGICTRVCGDSSDCASGFECIDLDGTSVCVTDRFKERAVERARERREFHRDIEQPFTVP